MGNSEATEAFVSKARKRHGDRYDYSQVEYRHNKAKVSIVCSTHGVFEQTPSNHLSGSGCSKCGREAVKSKLSRGRERFIVEANEIHNGTYRYSKVDYKESHTKVRITCNKHGDFEQSPASHLQGHGCPQCAWTTNADQKRMELCDFVRKARDAHGDRYDYSLTKYTSYFEKVHVICNEHGDFYQTPSNHIKGKGCPKCKAVSLSASRLRTKDEFVSIANDLYDNAYGYSKVNYTGSQDKVIITCPDHGDFEKSPNNHILGQGCPTCAKKSYVGWGPSKGFYKTDNPAHLYVLKFSDEQETFIKVGVAKDLNARLNTFRKKTHYDVVLLDSFVAPAIEVVTTEKSILWDSHLEKYRPLLRFDGHSECFYEHEYEGLLAIANDQLIKFSEVV